MAKCKIPDEKKSLKKNAGFFLMEWKKSFRTSKTICFQLRIYSAGQNIRQKTQKSSKTRL